MTYYGADVTELRSLAQSCERAANCVNAIVLRLNVLLGATRWQGPDAAAFRSSWHGSHRAALRQTQSALHSVAIVLRRNAEQQEQASAASAGPQGSVYDSSRVSSSYGEYEQVGRDAPTNAQQLWYTGYNMPNADHAGDGYRIQTVLGADGETRMVVYINGTDGGKDLGFWSNVPIILHEGNAETQKVELAVAAAQKAAAASGSPISEVMLVGYSQGGMIAQNLADSGAVQGVSTVVTFGSPVVEAVNDYGGASVIRIADNTDLVPGGIIPGLDSLARGTDAIAADAEGMTPSTGSESASFNYTDPTAAGNVAGAALIGGVPGVVVAAWSDHASKWMYGDDAAAFDSDQSNSAQQSHGDLARFGGTVMADVS